MSEAGAAVVTGAVVLTDADGEVETGADVDGLAALTGAEVTGADVDGRVETGAEVTPDEVDGEVEDGFGGGEMSAVAIWR